MTKSRAGPGAGLSASGGKPIATSFSSGASPQTVPGAEDAAVRHRKAPLPSGPIGRLLASVGNLSYLLDSIHSRYAQEHGLGARGVWTLSAISEGSTTPGDIARLMLLPPSVVSGDLNDLMDRGLIERRKDAGDRRRLIYNLTEEGQALLAGAHQVYVGVLGDMLESYPREQLDSLLRLLFDVSRHVRGRVEGDSLSRK